MLPLQSGLAEKLQESHVRIEVPDRNTVRLRNVPTNRAFFSKATTNVILQRLREPTPFVVGVDEDLEYRGSDRELTRSFAKAPRKRGWQLLALEERFEDFDEAVEYTLRVVGFGGREPFLAPKAVTPERPARKKAVLESFGTNLTQMAAAGQLAFTLGRGEELLEVQTCLLQQNPRLPLIAADGRVGKTNLLGALAAELSRRRPEVTWLRVDLGELFAGTMFEAEREELLSTMLKEITPEIILALERLELAVLETRHGAMLLSEALARGTKLVGTTYRDFDRRHASMPLFGYLRMVELSELDEAETAQVLVERRRSLAEHHGVEIPDSLCGNVVERSRSLAGPWPAKAIDLLDAAAARAFLSGAREAEAVHVYLAANRFVEKEAK